MGIRFVTDGKRSKKYSNQEFVDHSIFDREPFMKFKIS